MRWLSALTLAILLVGCGFVTIEIHQSSILDKGDGTTDTYQNRQRKSETDKVQVKEGI